MKKTFSFILCFSFIFVFFGINAEALGTSAGAHILMDADTGVVLSAKNENKKMKMASTTKIMTTLLTLESAEKENETVTFTDKMTAEGSSMYLKVGDKVKLTDLAAGMMMASGNDAANAAALHIGKSFENFSRLMNLRAEKIGMKNTSFVTPSGLDDENHYSTAYDMALLMAQALRNESFKALTACTEKKVEFVYPEGKVTTYLNHNRLLKSYSYCTGGKTGYTEKAGRCLVSSASKDGVNLIAVTLSAPDDWNDHKALYEYGFSMYTEVTLDDRNESFNVKLSGGEQDSLTASADEAVKVKVPADCIKEIKKQIYLPDFVFAPVKAGDTTGKIIYTLDGVVLAEVNLKVIRTVEAKPQPNFFVRFLRAIFNRE